MNDLQNVAGIASILLGLLVLLSIIFTSTSLATIREHLKEADARHANLMAAMLSEMQRSNVILEDMLRDSRERNDSQESSG